MANPHAARTILVADDEPAVLRSFDRLLRRAGFEVVGVSDGQSAVDALRTYEFDVILSDIHMPGMDGVELLRVVREHDLDVPVILMTADPRIETAAQAVELGALQYLVKPIPVEALFKALERASKLHLMARMKRETMKLLGQLDSPAGDRLGLGASLDRSLAGMWAAFQPIVSAKDFSVFGYESLLRSDEPSLPHPGAVIGAAERLDRLPDLGRRIRQLSADAFDASDGDWLLFINLHTKDLLDANLVAADSPLSKMAKRVVLEITERSALDDIKDVRSRIAKLRSMGYRIAIDDLGAGYAGLTSFAVLEPEFVKFDMSLVRDIHESPIRQKLIGSMTQLSQEMGMKVIAEGVERVQERDVLIKLGCDLLQGYLFAKPGRPFPRPSESG